MVKKKKERKAQNRTKSRPHLHNAKIQKSKSNKTKRQVAKHMTPEERTSKQDIYMLDAAETHGDDTEQQQQKKSQVWAQQMSFNKNPSQKYKRLLILMFFSLCSIHSASFILLCLNNPVK